MCCCIVLQSVQSHRIRLLQSMALASSTDSGAPILQVGQDLKGKVNEAGRKAQNVVGNNAGLPSPQEAADKVKGKVDELGRNVQGAGSNNPLSGNVPSPQQVRFTRSRSDRVCRAEECWAATTRSAAMCPAPRRCALQAEYELVGSAGLKECWAARMRSAAMCPAPRRCAFSVLGT